MMTWLKKFFTRRRHGATPSFAPLRRCVGMLFLAALLSVGVTAQTPQATPPPPAPPRSGVFPKPVEETLSNGLRVIVIERRETPLVSAQLLIKNGGEVD